MPASLGPVSPGLSPGLFPDLRSAQQLGLLPEVILRAVSTQRLPFRRTVIPGFFPALHAISEWVQAACFCPRSQGGLQQTPADLETVCINLGMTPGSARGLLPEEGLSSLCMRASLCQMNFLWNCLLKKKMEHPVSGFLS